MKTPILETARLILRPISMDDATAIQKHFNNWNVIKTLSTAVPWPYPDDGAERFLNDILLPSIAKNEVHSWAIVIKSNGDELTGLMTLRLVPDEDGTHRGFWLAEPFWGQGYMTEAVCAVHDFAFDVVEMDKIVVANAVVNVGSRRVKEKTGAKYLGRCEIEHHEGGREAELWEVTKESWGEVRKALV